MSTTLVVDVSVSTTALIHHRAMPGNELPNSSLLFDHYRIKMALKATGGRREAFWMSSFGARSVKPTVVFGTASWLHRVREYHKSRAQYQRASVTLTETIDGRVYGNKPELARSAAYPTAFGKCLDCNNNDA